jgi:transcriptional regulator with XRE-family HTH domain
MSFGPWIRTEREKAEIGLNDFARSIAISPAYWSRIERGMEKAPKDELILAAFRRSKDSAMRRLVRPPTAQGGLLRHPP